MGTNPNCAPWLPKAGDRQYVIGDAVVNCSSWSLAIAAVRQARIARRKLGRKKPYVFVGTLHEGVVDDYVLFRDRRIEIDNYVSAGEARHTRNVRRRVNR